jgi:ribonuclease T2
MLRIAVARAALGLSALIVSGLGAAAQDHRQNAPGQFDFYVLSLSWSPSFCAAAAERSGDSATRQAQCGGRPYSFVVHGLWPQYERGFPEFCQVPAPRLDRAIVSSMLDLMPAPRLVFHEWDRHGTCSGLAPRAYFDTIRKVRAMVKIPPQYLELAAALTVTPGDVEAAFMTANPGLPKGAVAIDCDNRRLREVRICVGKDFQFRECAEVDRRSCRRDKIVMPPVRGG